jgi:hypothetical protein
MYEHMSLLLTKQQEHEADYAPMSSAEVKHLETSVCFQGMVLRGMDDFIIFEYILISISDPSQVEYILHIGVIEC